LKSPLAALAAFVLMECPCGALNLGGPDEALTGHSSVIDLTGPAFLPTSWLPRATCHRDRASWRGNAPHLQPIPKEAPREAESFRLGAGGVARGAHSRESGVRGGWFWGEDLGYWM